MKLELIRNEMNLARIGQTLMKTRAAVEVLMDDCEVKKKAKLAYLQSANYNLGMVL